jgi:hypothetical protein
MGKISGLVGYLRCPNCSGVDLRRSPRRGFVELVLLSSVGIRPFRCQSCATRFYGFRLRGHSSASRYGNRGPGLQEDLLVLVYGYGTDHQPFQEETSVRFISEHQGMINLAARVEPDQELVLLNDDSDEEQRCRVISVRDGRDGTRVAIIQIRQSPDSELKSEAWNGRSQNDVDG